jgi:hypothetical protein
MRKRTLCLAASAILFLALPVLGIVNQARQFNRDGLSFSYPADWTLGDESDANAQSVNIGKGNDEAKIIVVVLRRQMNATEMAQAQPAMTNAIVDALAQEITKLGAQVQRGSVSEAIGGVQAQGMRLRASLQGETGNADVFWLTLGNKLVHVVYVGSDQERARASYAWNMLCSTLRVGSGPVNLPQSAAPDLSSYTYRQITGNKIELYMDQWGRGYVHDLNNQAWVRIPDYSGRQSHHGAAQDMPITIHPSFCKTSNTMALMYAFGGLLVYDSGMYSAQNPNQAWRVNHEVSQRGQAFASISRSRVINHIAQVNDMLALAAGTNWICVYDLSTHQWINRPDPVDDSSAELDNNLVLSGNTARVRILNGPFCNYSAGSGSWRCER